MRLRPILVFVLAAALTACASTPGSPGNAAAPSAQQVAALAGERTWLQSWFKGTPVRIEQRGDDAVSIEIPHEFCFDAGRSNVKPALGAVLDKVAESLRRVPQVRLERIAAPADRGASSAPLALRRATQMRAHLVERGAPAVQLGDPETAPGDEAQLRLALMPAPPA